MRPNILHIISSLPTVGGTSAKIYKLIEGSKYDHFVYYPPTKTDDLYINNWLSLKNCKLIKRTCNKNLIKSINEINNIIRKYNINIIHAYFLPGTILASILKILNPKIIIIRSFEGNINQGFIKEHLLRFSIRNFDQIIFISNYVKRFYSTKLPNTIKNKSVVIYNSAAQEEALNKKILHNVNLKKLVTISGLNKHKNLFILIETIHLLVKDIPDIQLEIIGDGNLRAELEKKISEYELNSNIKLLGYKKNVINYLDNSSIYVHPADNEGFGIAVIEAMARYCAVIVSNKGALPEIITNNENGIIADAYNPKEWCNKIKYLLNNQEIVNKLGDNAYNTAINKFSSEHYINSHDQIYLELYKRKNYI